MRFLLLVALLLPLGGCKRLMGYSDAGEKAAIRQYPDGPDGLRDFWNDVLEAAKKDDRERVHDLMATLILRDDELAALFGPQAAALTPRYHNLMANMVNRGAIEFVAQVYERKLDTVEVTAIDPTAPDAGAEDRALAPLKLPIKWYSVRIRRAADVRGLRYDFFFYKNGRWVTGNQLGKYISVADLATPAAPAPAAPAKPAAPAPPPAPARAP
jgi:hypothetical protein